MIQKRSKNPLKFTKINHKILEEIVEVQSYTINENINVNSLIIKQNKLD